MQSVTNKIGWMNQRLSFLVWRVAFFFYCWYETMFNTTRTCERDNCSGSETDPLTPEDMALLELLLSSIRQPHHYDAMPLSEDTAPPAGSGTRGTTGTTCPTH